MTDQDPSKTPFGPWHPTQRVVGHPVKPNSPRPIGGSVSTRTDGAPALTDVTPLTVRRLRKRGDTAGLLALLDRTDVKQSPKRKKSVLLGLKHVGDSMAIPSLVRIIECDSDAGVRAHALGALTVVADRSVVAFLEEILHREHADNLRIHVIHALGHTRASEAVAPLIWAMRGTSQAVRMAAADRLADIGDPVAIPVIESALRETRNPFYRKSFKMALERLRGPC